MTEPQDPGAHRRELSRFVAFAGLVGLLSALSYAVPAAEPVRPWLPGEPIPLVRLFLPKRHIEENRQGELVVREEEAPAEPVAIELAAPPDPRVPPLPDRAPVRPIRLEIPPGALDAWFAALAQADAGEAGFVARALHFGDSTIAGDGITATVRERLQARFGDGGPGFLAVQVDPRWSLRPSITRVAKGDWTNHTIIFGEAPSPRYGLAGTASTATGEATSYLADRKGEDGTRPLRHHFDLYYMTQPDGGSFSARARGGPGLGRSTASSGYGDGFARIDDPDGAESLSISTAGDGPVTFYGVAIETDGPGVTWETLGVAGAGQGSMLRQSRAHLAGQLARRAPHLVVYMTGGNELGYPTLSKGEGEEYKDSYRSVLDRLRRGAPEASCMVISPLDQAERNRGEVRSKPMLTRMVNLQRQVAYEEGCAFWDARGAMGGEGSFARWLAMDPPMAWTDLIHLSDRGLDQVGQAFADAMEAAYDQWRIDRPTPISEGSTAP